MSKALKTAIEANDPDAVRKAIKAGIARRWRK